MEILFWIAVAALFVGAVIKSDPELKGLRKRQ